MTTHADRQTSPAGRRPYVADAHNDLLMSVAVRPHSAWRASFEEQWMPQLRAGGVGLQLLPVCVDPALPPEACLRRMLLMIEAGWAISQTPGVTLVRDRTTLEQSRWDGHLGVVLGLEGCTALGSDLALLETVRRMGIRLASLVHVGRNPFADSATEHPDAGRLTTLGVEAVAELERLGIAIDVSHLSSRGLEHLLGVARRPLIATHSSARALRDHPRNLRDDEIRAIADTGGLVCVNSFGPFLADGKVTIDHLLDHLEHVITIATPSGVGLGPDFVHEVLHDIVPRWDDPDRADSLNAGSAYIPGLEGPAGLPLIVDAMRGRGWAEEDIRAVMGENLYGFLQTMLD